VVPDIIRENLPIIAISGILLGIDKGGIKSTNILAMYFMLSLFPAKTMLAIYAPLILVGEFYPVWHYRKQANYQASNRFIPWAILGLLLGTIVGTRINEKIFGLLIGILVLSMATLTLVRGEKGIGLEGKRKHLISAGLGVLAGFGSIIGNAGGGVTNFYFLSTTNNKNSLIGSSSYLYCILNSVKLLLYLFLWRIFTRDTVTVTLCMVPFMAIGIVLATLLLKVMSEKTYQILVYIAIFYAGISLILKNI